MPSRDTLKQLMSSTIGQQLKESSDMVMQDTWYNDIQTRTCYIYDYFHDNELDKLNGYTPNTESGKFKVDLKFIVKEYKSASKDEPEYHIQFSPDDWNNMILPDWFKDNYEKYGIRFPIGLYVDIPDDRGVYWKWMVFYDEVANQFLKYGVIRCNYQFMWVKNDGTHRYKRKMWGTERTQNSYTSGTWRGDKELKFDEQGKFWIPWNSISAELIHDMRLFISMLQPQPFVYQVSKIKNTAPRGIIAVTVEQVEFDSNTDYVNFENGEMYADYYAINDSTPVEETKENDNRIELTCALAQLKIGGGYKTITATCFDKDSNNITEQYNDFKWNYYIDSEDVSKYIIESQPSEINKIKIKSNFDENYLGKILTVQCYSNELISEINLTIMAL